MNAANPLPIALHEDVALFREALRFTAAETGFISRLIEIHACWRCASSLMPN